MDAAEGRTADSRTRCPRTPVLAPVLLALLLFRPAYAQPQPPSPAVLHTAHQIHALSAEDAARGYPIHLDRAQVTYFQPSFGALFLMDQTDGIYANPAGKQQPAIQAGDIVAVDGIAGPGDVAPVILRARFRVLGHLPLPDAPLVSLDRLSSGAFDSRWVTVEGIVRSIGRPQRRTDYDGHTTFDDRNVILTLASGEERLEVITFADDAWNPEALVDAVVRLRAVVGTRFNQRNQFIGVHLYMPDHACIRVLRPAPADPFRGPLTTVTGITRIGVREPGHRVHIRGVITSSLGGQHFSVMDSEHGIFVTAATPLTLQPGDQVDVAGFPSIGDYTDILDSAVLRRIGTAPLPPPIRLTPAEALAGVHDAESIEIVGTLTERHFDPNGMSSLRLTDAGIAFHSILSPDVSADFLRSLQPGSRLRVRGICIVHTSFDKTPQTFDIVLRSPDDLLLLRRPGWWNLRRAAVLAVLLSTIVCVIVVWNLQLRRLVTVQTRQIQAQFDDADALRIQAEAAHQEKSESLANLLSLQRDLLVAQDSLRYEATHDALTGLHNRAALLCSLNSEISRSLREHTSFGVLMLDVDHFKPVNDTRGHLTGDAVLQEIARRLNRSVRSYDVVGRYGGEEFLIILPGCTREQTRSSAERIRAAIAERPFTVGGPAVAVTVSIGATIAPRDAQTEYEILTLADEALYKAKRSGRNRTILHTASAA